MRPLAALPGGVSRTRQVKPARPWPRALLWLAFLGPFFFVSYSYANSWAARLPHVASFAFPWEKHIPFLPWTILPYMSIDLFYAASLFLCATRKELDTHAKRLLAATVISVACFLLFPLQCTFTKPETHGFNGALFAMLGSFDKPFNQLPSLHISLLILLWVTYARHLRGILRALLHGWFLLIGISVFTTWQHQIIDGIGGLVVGLICLYLLPEHALRRRHDSQIDAQLDTRRKVLAGRYLLGALACVGCACMLQSFAWLLLWPAASLLIVSFAYGRFGVSAFQKQYGRHSLAAGFLLAPYRAAAWLSSRWLTTHRQASVEVEAGIWIGRAPSRRDWRLCPAQAVLDLTAEFEAGKQARSRTYANVAMLDLVPPTQQQLRDAVHALNQLRPHGPVLVHCALGYSRSVLVVCAWLLQQGRTATVHGALTRVGLVRPHIVMPESYLAVLREFNRANNIKPN